MKMKALDGISVVSLAYNLPGPLLVSKLQKLGATIAKIEPPSGDPMNIQYKSYYDELIKGQKIIKLNLKESTERKTLDSYLEKADLLITSSKDESLNRLSLDWANLHKNFPKLCHLAMIGYLNDKNRVGHDLTYQASAGLLQPPQLPLTCFADFAGAQEACIQAMALLMKRKETGSGARTEVSIVDSLLPYRDPIRFGMTGAKGKLSSQPKYNLYKTKDGWLAVAPLEDHFWERLQAELEIKDPTYEDLSKIFISKTSDDWEKWAIEKSLPFSAVRKVDS